MGGIRLATNDKKRGWQAPSSWNRMAASGRISKKVSQKEKGQTNRVRGWNPSRSIRSNNASSVTGFARTFACSAR